MSPNGSRSKSQLLLLLFLVGGFALYGLSAAQTQKPAAPTSAANAATDDWKKELDDLCSRTQDAMTFSVKELKGFVERCDALESQLEKLDDTRKKVYLRRLRQARGLFAYVLYSKQKEAK